MLRLRRYGVYAARLLTTASSSQRKYASASLLDDLFERGFIQDITRKEKLRDVLSSHKQVVYSGVDPTASALHVGHLVPMMCLLHFRLHGHQIIPLIGRATGLIGDPSGRTIERELADPQRTEDNADQLTKSLHAFFRQALDYADTRTVSAGAKQASVEVMSNLTWHQDVKLLDFLRDVGVHVRVNTMLNRESVQSRMDSRQGISFTEFTYQLLQAYDFLHLHKAYGCSIQIGGSDQWGNILAGLELINRLKESASTDSNAKHDAFAITTPLLTTASGQKFGKSAGNAVWLDKQLTSVHEFYQFFLRTADGDVNKYLKLFTLLSPSAIEEIMIGEHKDHPEMRIAQHLLASEVTELVHGKAAVAQARAMAQLLFSPNAEDIKASKVIALLHDDPSLVIVDQEMLFTTPVVKLASMFYLVPSTSAARSLVYSRGLYLNNEPLKSTNFVVTKSHLIDGRLIIIRAGKQKHLVIATQSQ